MEEKEVERKKKQSKKAYECMFSCLKDYNDMKHSLKNDTTTPCGEKNAFLASIEKSKMQTAVVIKIIDDALEELEKEQEGKGQKYKTDVLRMYFFEKKTYEQILEQVTAGDSTPRRWVSEMVGKMAIKLFGVDGTDLNG